MNPTAPETGRITLTLTAKTIRNLRMLAVLQRTNQSQLAEYFISQGGLRDALTKALDDQKSKKPAAGATQAPPMLPNPAPAPLPAMAPAPSPTSGTLPKSPSVMASVPVPNPPKPTLPTESVQLKADSTGQNKMTVSISPVEEKDPLIPW